MQNIKNIKNVSVTKQPLPTRGMINSPANWTKEKAQRDSQLWGNQDSLWIIENKLYDLSEYVDKHPGGKHWLTMTKGQDITEHFITHHLNEDKARAVLGKYYKSQARIKQKSRFSFEEDGLFRMIKKKLLEQYPPEKLQDSSKSELVGSIFLAIWVVLFVLSALNQSYILAILCGWVTFSCIGVGHNFLHMKDHPFRFLWLLTGMTHRQWQQMHCLSHHSYANTHIDFEMEAFEPISFYLKTSPKNKAIAWIAKELILLTLAPLNILLKLFVNPVRDQKEPEWLFVVPLVQIPLLWFLTGQLGLSFKLFLAIHLTFGFIFSKMTLYTHRSGQEWTGGYEQISDYAEHQINTTSETPTEGCRGFWSYLLYGGFNYHAIHHLFPTIDNYQLPQATVVMERQAKKKGISIKRVKGVWQGISQTEKHYFNRRQWIKKD